MKDYRKDFPILDQDETIYFDNAATAQKPACVMEALTDYYSRSNANPLRGLYDWSLRATEVLETARQKAADLIGAAAKEEIIFTRNTTEALNLAAYSYALNHLKAGDEIAVCISEHHSNFLPWQMAAEKTGAVLRFLEPGPDGRLTAEEIRAKITPKCRLAAVAQVSNVLGRVQPVREIADRVHEVGAVLVVDGAQSVPHMAVDVQAMDADFFAFSGHKMMGPMGIGVLYGKQALLEKMPPFLRGGEMIEYVTKDSASWAELPHKFEAGTVNAADAAGLSAAIDYLAAVGYEEIGQRELALTRRLMGHLKEMPYVTVYGSEDPAEHCGIVTFNIEGCHPHDVASILNEDGIAIRAGHHCAQPLMQYLGINAACRASLYFYNTEAEVDRFAKSLKKVRGALGYGS